MTKPTASATVINTDVYIQEDNIEEGAFRLLKSVRPSWNPERVQFKNFTEGITNKLVGCWAENNLNDTVLIRIYGQNTSLIIDREAETRSFKLLHEAGYAPQLYATFLNGLAYEYIPGVILNLETVRDPEIYPLVATMLAKIHKVQYDTREPQVWNTLLRYLNLVPERYSNSAKQQLFSKKFPDSIKSLRRELSLLKKELCNDSYTTVFCHNDLLLANILHTEGTVTFIDYEYAGCNYQAFDIGNHFAEFAGVSSIDYSNYPSPDFQRSWIKIYLQEFKSDSNVTEQEIEQLYIQVNKFSLASHLLWASWSLVQAEYSKIDFDFISYAAIRMQEFNCKKERFLSLQETV